MKRVIPLILVVLSAVFALAETRTWKSTVTEGWFDEAANWENSKAPTSITDAVKFYPNSDTSYRVYLPSLSSPFCRLVNFTRPGSTLELIGTNREEAVSVFTLPKLDSGTYERYALSAYDNQSNGYMIFFLDRDAASANAVLTWTNAYFKATEENAQYDLTIGGGFLNLLDPDGVTTNKAELRMALYAGVGHRAINAHFDGEGMRAYALRQFAKAEHSSVSFSHGTYTFAGGFYSGGEAEVVQTNETVVTDSAYVKVENKTANFGLCTLTKGLCKLSVRNGGVFDLYDCVSSTSDAAVRFAGNTAVSVSGGGRLALPSSVSFGASSSEKVTSLSLADEGSSVYVRKQSDKSFARLSIGGAGAARVDVSGGYLSGEGGLYIPLGLDLASGSATNVLNVSGGRIDATHSDPGIDIGGYGPAEMNVSGGEIDCCDLRLGVREPTSAGTVALFRQTGGTVSLTNVSAVRVCVNNSSKRIGRLILDGGVLETYNIYGEKTVAAGYAGYGELLANGGTIRPNARACAASTPVVLLQNLDAAKLGPKGLTVDTPAAIEISQKFENADLPGRLVKTGAGTLTLSAVGSTQSYLDIAEGTVALGASATLAASVTVTNGAIFDVSAASGTRQLGGLVLGNADSSGRLVVTTASRLETTAAPSFPKAEIALSGSIAVGTYPLVTTTAAVSDAVKDGWRQAWISSERPSNLVLSFDVSESEGVTSFNLVVTTAAAPSRIVNWPWGETELGADAVATFGETVSEVSLADETVVGKVSFPAGAGSWTIGGAGSLKLADTGMLGGIEVNSGRQTIDLPVSFVGDLVVTVAKGAWLCLQKPVVGDRLVKVGEGRLVLANAASIFCKGVEIQQGTIDWPEGPITLPRLKSNGTTHSNVVLLDMDADLTAEEYVAPRGAPVKLGTGTLVLKGTGTDAIYLTRTWGYFSSYESPAGQSMNIPSDTTLPAGGYGPFSVFEGEVVLRGTGSSIPTFASEHPVQVGVRSTNAVARTPGLVIDHAKLQLKDADKHAVTLFVAANAYTNEYSDAATSPYVYVTNNATLTVAGLDVGRLVSGGGIDISPRFVVADGSSFVGEGNMSFNRRAGCSVSLVVSNASSFLTSLYQVSCAGPTIAEFSENSMFTGSLKLGSDMDGYWAFRSGSSYAPTGFVQEGTPARSSLVFDGGSYVAGTGDASIRLAGGLNVKLIAEDEGIIFDVPSASTWRLYQKVEGSGAVVKRGAGHLSFERQSPYDASGSKEETPDDPETLGCDGGVCIEEGSISFAEGIGKGLFSGGGTVKDSTLSATRISLQLDDAGQIGVIPTFDNCTFEGAVKVDFGRGHAKPSFNPKELGAVAVARLANDTGFDASQWHSSGIGHGLQARFFCEDGVVKATFRWVGLQVLIR